MALTSEGASLTEAHRLAQARLGAQTVRDLRAVWDVLDLTDLAGTTDTWLRSATGIVIGQSSASAELAADYLTLFRSVEIGGRATIPPLELADPTAIAQSLTVTGPVSIKKAAAAGIRPSVAGPIAQNRSAAAGMRHALNGGRRTIVDHVRSDPDARGWRRVTSGKACDFCRMLADRGAVYGEGTSHFAAHDACSCSAEPSYDSSRRRAVSAWTGRRDISAEQRRAENARTRAWIDRHMR